MERSNIFSLWRTEDSGTDSMTLKVQEDLSDRLSECIQDFRDEKNQESDSNQSGPVWFVGKLK